MKADHLGCKLVRDAAQTPGCRQLPSRAGRLHGNWVEPVTNLMTVAVPTEADPFGRALDKSPRAVWTASFAASRASISAPFSNPSPVVHGSAADHDYYPFDSFSGIAPCYLKPPVASFVDFGRVGYVRIGRSALDREPNLVTIEPVRSTASLRRIFPLTP